MEILHYCEVELRSLADLEKFRNITDNRIKCENVTETNEETVVVKEAELTELNKWFNVRNVKDAVCLDGILYVKF